MSLAFRCEECDGEPTWTLVRRGDVAMTWACEAHVSEALLRLQRDHEVTEVVVTHTPKAHEWAGITRALRAVAAEDQGGEGK